MAATRIGLTGGIASGKSTAAERFKALGVPLIDTDDVAKALVTQTSPTLTTISRAFGPDVLNQDGTLNRAALREIVFANESARLKLESIMHPPIWAMVDEFIANHANAAYVVVVVPLLVETNSMHHFDRILLIDTDEPSQRQRLAQRGIDTKLANQILAAQATRQQRSACADDIVDNNGDLAQLTQQIDALHAQYLQQS